MAVSLTNPHSPPSSHTRSQQNDGLSSENAPKKGFLLTRNSRDINQRTEIEIWVATDNGPALLRFNGERPIFFIDQSNVEQSQAVLEDGGVRVEFRSLALKTFNHHPVCGVYCPTIQVFFRAQEALQRIGVEVLEGDIRLHERFLVERFICGGIEFTGDAIQREGYVEYVNGRLKPVEYRPPLTVTSLDIECELTGELFSIGLAHRSIRGESREVGRDGHFASINEVLMIGHPSDDHKTRENKNDDLDVTTISWFDDEKHLILGLISRIQEVDPDIFIGWSLVNFDFRVLFQRANFHRIKFKIGRGNQIVRWRDANGDKEKGFITIPGRVAIDGIDALKSATYSFPSFSLESVSRKLLSKGKKVEQDVDDRFAEIKHNFLHNKRKLAEYNMQDCILVLEVFEYTQMLDFLQLRGQLTGLELDRAGGSVAAFTNLYLPRLHRAGYIAPVILGEGGLTSPGGYVMDSIPGLYKDVLVLDFKSLYPSIIRTFKVDPLGLIEGLKSPDNAIEGFRGAKFDREKHFLPEIITDLWKQRDIAKKNNDKVRSQAIKILMNSFYGVLGAGGCRFYDPRLTSSITMRGHEILQTTQRWIEKLGYQVIYGDTDSIFVWLQGELDAKTCQRLGDEIAEIINQGWREKLKADFDLDCHLEIEFETHFSRFLMPTVRGSEAGSKKRYAGLISKVPDDSASHGVASADTGALESEIIFKGLENVRTDWTDLAKEFQAKLYELVFADKAPTELVKQTVDDTLKGLNDDKLVYRKQLRRKLDQYVKNVPPHVRAARLADQRNRESGKQLRYQSKGWISYVMTLNGPEPVEYLNSQIDYQHYIDRQIQPVADAILPFVNLDFETITSAQAVLF
ncbi:MAG: DNA polymerase II [Gammaproteobacteria bacterium]|nr:DNA polymerase II [Gammaproteobacteria bacterium]